MEVKSLPLELWIDIASYGTQTDLISLALVSSFHLGVSRPLMYKDVILQRQGEDGGIGDAATVNLLLRDGGSLAKYGQRLELRWHPHGRENGFHEGQTSHALHRMHEVTGDMANLRTLCMKCAIPSNSPALIPMLTKNCPLLKEFELDERYCVATDHLSSFGLAGIQRIKWWNSREVRTYPFSSKIFISLLAASSSTITHLLIPGPWDTHPGARAWPLFQANPHPFPVLDTLVLGPCGWFELEYQDELARFLYKNPTIKCLKLQGWDVGNDWHVGTGWDEMFDPLRFLPNLTSLEAHAEVVHHFSKHCPTSLSNLVDLRTGCPGRYAGPLTDMAEDLVRTGGLPKLKKVVVIAPRILTNDDGGLAKWMNDLVEACPALEEWEGDVSCVSTLTQLVAIFFKLASIRKITFSAGSMGDAIISFLNSHRRNMYN